MKFKFLKQLTIAYMLIVGTYANAGLINSDYLVLGDGLTYFDTETQFTWLDTTQTQNMTYANALSTFTDYRLASNGEIEDLFGKVFPNFQINYFGHSYYTGEGVIASNEASLDAFGLLNGTFGGSTNYTYGVYKDEDNISRLFGGWDQSGGSFIAGLEHNGVYESANTGYGVMMVKKTEDVPEPSTLAIFALGMMGLAARRFKKQA